MRTFEGNINLYPENTTSCPSPAWQWAASNRRMDAAADTGYLFFEKHYPIPLIYDILG